MVLDECIATPAVAGRPRADGDGALGAVGAPRARRGCCSFATSRRRRRPSRSPTPDRRSSGSSRAATDPDLRTESAQATVEIGFEGYAIGGLSVGEPVDVMYDVVGHTAPQLPAEQPRYLMGTGMPDDLVECVARGIDMFDCVLPTRNARNGQLLTRHGVLVIKNARYAEDRAAARPGLRLLHLPALQPRLPPSSLHGRRDDRGDPEHRP